MINSMGNERMRDALLEDACSFEFFQAVRLLQKLQPDLHPVGHFFSPDDEAVRFVANQRLAFPASTIQTIAQNGDAAPEMTVNFMGLTGPSGVLPYPYTEHILERMRAKDTTTKSFFDIFNHRLISLFFRAWQKHRVAATYGAEHDTFTHHLLDLLGLGTEGLQERQAVPDEALLNYLGLFALQSRSSAALEQIVENFFEVPAEVEQFRGAWYNLDENTQCIVGTNQDVSGQLGLGSVVGDAVWDQQSRARLKLGPMKLSRFLDFLPVGQAFKPLQAITRFFSNNEVDFEVQLILVNEETPFCTLDSEAEDAPLLGWSTWLKSKPLDRDPSETILNL